MNIAIIGPGALGSLLAARFTLQGHGVTLIDYDQERVDLLSNKLRYRSVGSDQLINLSISTSFAPCSKAELVVLCVKSHHLADLLSQVLALARDDCLILGLQNGIGHFLSRQVENRGPAVPQLNLVRLARAKRGKCVGGAAHQRGVRQAGRPA